MGNGRDWSKDGRTTLERRRFVGAFRTTQVILGIVLWKIVPFRNCFNLIKSGNLTAARWAINVTAFWVINVFCSKE